MLNRAEYRKLITLVGLPMEFHQTKAPQRVIQLAKAGYATAKADSPIVNAYGVGSKIITVLESDMGGLVPEKFDYVVVNSAEKCVFEVVHPVHEPATGAVIGYRCFVKGKG